MRFLFISVFDALYFIVGSELEEAAAAILNQQQSTLNAVLDQLAHRFAERYSHTVTQYSHAFSDIFPDVRIGYKTKIYVFLSQ